MHERNASDSGFNNINNPKKRDDKRKAYAAPELTVLGDMRHITLGGSQITEDSGYGPGTGPNV